MQTTNHPGHSDGSGRWRLHRRRFVAVGVTIVISILLTAVKFYAYTLTGSAAILSDALESIINVVASGFALWSIFLSTKPPDISHPYGHGKAEFFSAGFEGGLITLAAGGIIWEAFPRILDPQPLPNLDWALLLLLGTGTVNLLLGWALVRTGKATRSAAVLADGKHLLTDFFTTGGVVIGLLLVSQTEWLWLDGAIACIVAVNILFIGTKLIREAFSRLMDASDPELLERIAEIISKYRRPRWIEIHDLRALRSGELIHVDFHLVLPRDLSLEDAHQEVSYVEDLLKTHISGMTEPIIHAEPCLGPECPGFERDHCDSCCDEARQRPLWNRAPAGIGGRID
ncbi:MAG: cation diffusion facilitator family transporter, partial [Syntrophobacteraceae bacterium]